MEEYRVSTPEAVDLTYELAGIGGRFVAALIDGLIIVSAMVATIIVAAIVAAAGSNTVAAVFGLTVSFVIVFGYYIIFETLWHGQTPGKRAMGLRVMKTAGLPIGFTEALLRNLLRIVDILPVAYGIGVVVMFVGRQPRRVGDHVAGTIVVRERSAISLNTLEADTGGGAAAFPNEDNWDVAALTAEDDRLINTILAGRKPGPDGAHNRQMAGALASQLAARVGAPAHGPDAYTLLGRILALYRWSLREAPRAQVPLAPHEEAWNLRALTADHDRVIHEFLGRARRLPPEDRSRMGGKLAAIVARRIGAGSGGGDEAFLARVEQLRAAYGGS